MRVVLHPSFIRSKSDRQEHFIGASDLARLYCIRKDDIVIVDSKTEPRESEHIYKDYMHLYPRYDGDYFDIHSPLKQYQQGLNNVS